VAGRKGAPTPASWVWPPHGAGHGEIRLSGIYLERPNRGE
jgi:hypothetical protein